MINLFTTTASLGSGGIFTLETKNTKSGPRSAPLVAKELGLKTFINVESKFTSFFEGLQTCKDLGLKYRFGIKFRVTKLITDEASDAAEHKIIVFASGDKGYLALSKLYSASVTKSNYNLLDYSMLNSLWNKDLTLCIPFYDSYLFNNNIKFGSCMPEFPVKNPTHFIENNNLPFDQPLREIVKAASPNIMEVQTCYYSKPEDYKKFLVYRCMLSGETFNKPNMDNMYSNNFYPKHETKIHE